MRQQHDSHGLVIAMVAGDLAYLRTYEPTNLRTYVPTYLPTYVPTYVPTYLHVVVRVRAPALSADPDVQVTRTPPSRAAALADEEGRLGTGRARGEGVGKKSEAIG